MKKNLLLLFILPSFILPSYGQCSYWQWGKGASGDWADEGMGCCTDPFGNVAITGVIGSSNITFGTFTFPNAYIYGAYIVKYDPTGNILWAKSPTGQAYGYSVSSDAFGNTYATGSMGATLTFDSYLLTSSTGGAYLAKYDNLGNVMWAKNSTGGYAYAHSVSAGDSGYVYVSGYMTSSSVTFGTQTITSNGIQNTFLVKYDSSGNVIWARSGGGNGTDGALSVSADPAGDVIITGYFNSDTANFGGFTLLNSNPGSNDVFVVKYDGAGNVTWAKNFGGVGTDTGNSLSADADGNIVVTGYFSCPSLFFGTDTLLNASGYNMFVVKYNPQGNLIWARAPEAATISQALGVDTDTVGNIYVAAFALANPVQFGSLSITNFNTGYDPMFFVKFAPDGTPICGNYLESGGDDEIGIAVDDFGNIFVTADYMPSTFIVGPSVLNLTGLENAFVAKISNTIPVYIEKIEDASNLEISPNPISIGSQIVLSRPLQKAYIVVIDNLGREIQQNYFSGSNTKIKTEKFKRGIYLLKIISDEGVFTKKIIVE